MATPDYTDVELLRARLGKLIERADLDSQNREVAAEALEELAVVVEELQAQNAELIASRTDLEQERERHRLLFDTVPDGYVVTDSEGILREVNATAASMLGQPRQAFLGKALGSLIEPPDRRAFYAQLSKLRQQGPGSHVTLNLQVHDHAIIPVNLRASATATAGTEDTTIRWLLHDRRPELDTEELTRSEERLRNLFATAPIGILLLDISGRIAFANDAVDEIFGRRADETASSDWLAGLSPDDRERVRQAMKQVQFDGRRRTLVHELNDDGATRWIDHDLTPYRDSGGTLQGTLSIFNDVTPAYQASAELVESRDFTEAILDTISALVVVLTPTGHIQRFNAACETLTGFTADEVVSRPIIETLIPEEERHIVGQVFDDLVSRRFGDFPQTYENDWLTADGGRRTISWTNTALLAEDGAPQVIIGTGIDVTETRSLQAQLAETERLDSLGRLAAGIAHDFNNTLSTLQLRLDRLARRTEDESDHADITAGTETIEHTKHLIADLLSFGSRQSLAREPLAINSEIERITDLLTDLLGDHIEIQLDLTAEPTVVLFDAARFEQLLTNLLINAGDAMPDGGTINLSTTVHHTTVHHQANDPTTSEPMGRRPWTSHVQLDVSDTGTGIETNDIARVFDPYFTTKPPARGTGLGLATTYGTITQHGGTISVASQVGVGTTFTIRLPIATPNTTQPERERVERPTALIVEDDAGMRKVLAEEVQLLGYRTITADSAEQALAHRDTSVDLLITDVQLPGMHGPQLAANLQNTDPSLSVVFVSGAPQATLATTLPADATIVTKPFSTADLAAAIVQLSSRPPER